MGTLLRLALLLALGVPGSAQQVQLAVPRLDASISGAPVLAPLSFAAPAIGLAAPTPSLSLRSVLPASVTPAPRVAAAAAPQTPAPIDQLTGIAGQVSANNAPGRSPPSEGETLRAAFDGQKLDHAPRLIIAGPPGAGKSTNAKRLAKEFGLVHIGAGDILREYARSDPAAAARMQKGELVDSDLVIGLIRERLGREDAVKNGFILDGFPRRLQEAESMKGIAIDAVIHLKVPEAQLRRRLEARKRADDTAEALRNRLEIYREQTLPAIERLGKDAPILTPKVSGGEETVYARVRAALLRLLAARPFS